MIGINRNITQRAVRRLYYAGDVLPDARQFVDIVCARVPLVKGFECKDVVRAAAWDANGVRCVEYIALFERDGTTIEARAAAAIELAAGREDVG
jgi:hypothetical protein